MVQPDEPAARRNIVLIPRQRFARGGTFYERVVNAFATMATGVLIVGGLGLSSGVLPRAWRYAVDHASGFWILAAILFVLEAICLFFTVGVFWFSPEHQLIPKNQLTFRINVLNQRSRKGQRDRIHQHYLKGHLFCARCERQGRTSRLIYTEAKSRNGSYYGYFMCRARQDKLGCDLSLLPAELVEDTITDHYHTLALPADFIDSVRELPSQTLADEQGSVRTMHAQLAKRIKDLDQKEERLIDLAADDSLPQDKIRIRLRRIQSDRASAQAPAQHHCRTQHRR